MQKIAPFLWFNDNGEEAMDFYANVFPNASITSKQHYPEGSPMPAGTFMTGTIDLYGQQFVFLNGGPLDSFNHAISFVISCDDQEELDGLWNALLEGGTPEQCGWIKDKFGVLWQIVPKQLDVLLADSDPKKAQQTMAAMLKMVKLDISELQSAHDA